MNMNMNRFMNRTRVLNWATFTLHIIMAMDVNMNMDKDMDKTWTKTWTRTQTDF